MAKSQTRGSSVEGERRLHTPEGVGSTPAPATKGAADWEAIERDYRAGLLSVREIAASDGNVTEGAIRKRAKRDAWTRDLSAKIHAKADELVRTEVVRKPSTQLSPASERQIIEANAERIAQVRSEHRGDIRRGRELVLRLLAELEAETGDLEAFRNLGLMLAKPDEKGVDKLNEAYHKAISLPQRVSSVKGLTEALKNLVALEREAYGIGLPAGENPEAQPVVSMALDVAARRMAFLLQAGLVAKKGAR